MIFPEESVIPKTSVTASTRPVTLHMITVAKKLPDIETRACLPGVSVFAAAAAIEAVPSPASLVINPRLTPTCKALSIVDPRKPPKAAWPVNAVLKIMNKASGIRE